MFAVEPERLSFWAVEFLAQVIHPWGIDLYVSMHFSHLRSRSVACTSDQPSSRACLTSESADLCFTLRKHLPVYTERQ